jgi:tetratricopeptide (TPR) repeat protein
MGEAVDHNVDLPSGPDVGLGLDLHADLPTPVDLDLPAPVDDLPAPVDLDLPAPADLDLPAPVDLDLPAPVDNLLAPVEDLLTPAEILPTPVDNLPTPAEILPTPADNLPAPAEILPTPVDEGQRGDVDLDLDVDLDEGEAARPRGANLVDAHDRVSARPSTAVPGPDRPMTSPAPKEVKGPSRAVIYGGLAAVLVLGGAGAAYALGVFDGQVTDPVPNGTSGGEAPPQVPAGEVAERSEPVMAKFDLDTPAAYQQAGAISEQANDKVGQAEAALLTHLRYGPDGVLAGQAQAFLEPVAGRTEPFVSRVFALADLAGANADAALQKLTGDDPRSRLYKSWALLEQGKVDEARTEAAAASQARPNDKAAALAVLMADMAKDPVAGLDALRGAADQSPDHLLYQRRLVEGLLARGLLAEAHQRGEKLAAPGAAGAGVKSSLLALRAEVATARGDRATALRLYEQAASVAPDARVAQIARLDVLLRGGEVANVRGDLETMTHKDPGLVSAQLLLAELGIATGQGDQALAALGQVAEKLPNDPRVHDLKGQVFAMRMQTEDARAAFAKAREADPNYAEATVHEARLLVKLKKTDDALSLLDAQQAAARERNTTASRRAASTLLRAQAEALSGTGRHIEALEAVVGAVSVNPDDNDARLMHANMLLTLGKSGESETVLLELYERTGGYPGITSPLGRVYLRKKQLDELEGLIGGQLNDADAPDDILLTGALLRLHQEKLGQAKGLVDRVMARSPDSWEGHLVKCQIMLRDGDYATALMEIQQSRPRTPNGEVELWRGQALEYNGQPKEAMTHYERALQIEPSLTEAAALYGRLLAYSGTAKKAIEILEPVVEQSQEFPYAYAALGRAKYDLGKRDSAIKDFKTAYKLDPKLFEAYYWEGRIHGDKNKHGAAAKALAAGVKVAAPTEPYLPDAYRRLGDAYRSAGRNGEAKAAYEKYLEVAPPNASGRTAVQRLLQSL